MHVLVLKLSDLTTCTVQIQSCSVDVLYSTCFSIKKKGTCAYFGSSCVCIWRQLQVADNCLRRSCFSLSAMFVSVGWGVVGRGGRKKDWQVTLINYELPSYPPLHLFPPLAIRHADVVLAFEMLIQRSASFFSSSRAVQITVILSRLKLYRRNEVNNRLINVTLVVMRTLVSVLF